MSPVALAGLAAHLATTSLHVQSRVLRLDPDSGQARTWVEQELAKDDYRDRRSLLQQLVDWLRRRFADLQNPQGRGDLSFPPFVIAALAVVIVIALVVLATRVRRERRVVGTAATVLGDSVLTASQLRDRAAKALREGRHDDAVLDTVRAMARDADARTLLTDAPSLTAHEIGRQLSEVFPDHAEAVTRATDRFDAVAYGHRSADRRDADDVMATDEALRRARPALPQHPRRGEGLRVTGPAVAPGELVGTGRGPWSSSRGPGGPAGPAGPVGPRGDATKGAPAPGDDPGSVWTTGGGA